MPRFAEWQAGMEDVRRSIAWQNIQDYPHIIAAWLDIRFKAWFKIVCQEELHVVDYWYRYEWQARGTGHIHCIVWLDKDAPEIGAKTQEERDVFAAYWSNKISAWHPDQSRRPDDRMPCSLPFARVYNTPDMLASLLNRIQRHTTCIIGGCLRQNRTTLCIEYRFFYPRTEQDIASITKDVNKKSWIYAAPRNDDRLNPYMASITLGWLANHDAQPIVTYSGLEAYVGKYASKFEKKSRSYQEMSDEVKYILA
jgi:ATP-dependent DNA helicase PIF1